MSNLELILNLFKEDFTSLESFVDILPIGVYITSPEGETFLVNDYIIEKFEYPSKEEFLKLNLNSPTSDINKQTRKLFLSILQEFNKVENFTFEYETYKDNLLFTKENALLLTNFQTNKTYIIGTLEDITESVKQQELQIKTSNFISAINEALLILIQESNSFEAITAACNVVGKSIDLSTINLYLFEADLKDKEKQYNNLITWENDSLVHQYQIEQLPGDTSEFIQDLSELFDYVELGNIYASNVSECEKEIKDKFKKLNVKSIIIAPIIYENNFIGFTVFVDNNTEREWKDYEINLLSLFSNSIGNTYKNNQKNQEILSLKTNLETIINASEAGLWDWDLSSNKVYINSNFAKHIGIDPEIKVLDAQELISQFDDEDKAKFENAIQAICCNRTPYFTFDFKLTFDNKTHWLNHYGKVLEWNEDGTTKRISGLLLDITDRKLVEQKLNEAIQTKDKFFDIISHDLKNPIFSVASQLDDLIQNYEMLSMNELYEINVQIQKSISVLSQLLNNLLDWSRSQTNRLSYNPDFIDVYYLAENVCELYKEPAKQKNINIINEITIGTKVWADSNMLFTIIRNLVSNAIKYTNSGGDIHLIAQENDEYYTFSVTDSGTGMSETVRNRLFKIEFVQSTPGTNQEKGTGLGLILCKEFAGRNKGKIWVESELGKGSIFNFTIPKFPLND
jgi:signal transduction histidine kinase